MRPTRTDLHGIAVSLVIYNNSLSEISQVLRPLVQSESVRQITVVDNSPLPNETLRSTVESYGGEYIYIGRNIGFGAGHNLALKKHLGKAKYQLVINPDITFESNVLNSLYCFMDQHPNVGLVMPRILYPDGSEQRLCKQLPSPLDLVARRFLGKWGSSLLASQRARYELRHLDMERIRQVPCLSGCFMFLRSSVLREIGFFDERYFMYMEDFDLCRRIGAEYRTVYYPKVYVTHCYGKGSYISPRLLIYHLQSGFRYFQKWGWIFDSERKELNKRTALLQESIPVNRRGDFVPQ